MSCSTIVTAQKLISAAKWSEFVADRPRAGMMELVGEMICGRAEMKAASGRKRAKEAETSDQSTESFRAEKVL